MKAYKSDYVTFSSVWSSIFIDKWIKCAWINASKPIGLRYMIFGEKEMDFYVEINKLHEYAWLYEWSFYSD